MIECAIKSNTFGSMDRIYLEGWLIANNIQYRLGKYGNWLAWLTFDQMYELQSEGWVVFAL